MGFMNLSSKDRPTILVGKTGTGKTTKAKEGRLIIWPAYWTHRHHGIVSKSQIKYIATGWYKYV